MTVESKRAIMFSMKTSPTPKRTNGTDTAKSRSLYVTHRAFEAAERIGQIEAERTGKRRGVEGAGNYFEEGFWYWLAHSQRGRMFGALLRDEEGA